VRVVAAGERGVERLFGIEAQPGDAAGAGFKLHQHLAEARVAGRSANQADMRRALENLLAFLLRHAAQDTEDLALAGALELLQAVEDLLLGLIADAARVVEDQPGVFAGSATCE
jgi:hypothetical protein